VLWLCIRVRSDGHFQRMDGFSWTRASYVAALVAGAITCLLIGMLVGVLASANHPHSVLQVITDPVQTSAHDLRPASRDEALRPARSSTTVTSTFTVAAAARTVTTPAQTVTETETQTVTVPAPTSTQQTTNP
jgi:cytoskeletal protein RodZ